MNRGTKVKDRADTVRVSSLNKAGGLTFRNVERLKAQTRGFHIRLCFEFMSQKALSWQNFLQNTFIRSNHGIQQYATKNSRNPSPASFE